MSPAEEKKYSDIFGVLGANSASWVEGSVFPVVKDLLLVPPRNGGLTQFIV